MARLAIRAAVLAAALCAGAAPGCSGSAHTRAPQPAPDEYTRWLDGLSDEELAAEIARLQGELGVRPRSPGPNDRPPAEGRPLPAAAPGGLIVWDAYPPPVYHYVSATAVPTYVVTGGWSDWSGHSRSYGRGFYPARPSAVGRGGHAPRGGTLRPGLPARRSVSLGRPGSGWSVNVSLRSDTLNLRGSAGSVGSRTGGYARGARPRR